MATLRYEPEIATPERPPALCARLSAIRTELPAILRRPMLMLNYHTNARNSALVRFNPAARSRPALASPHSAALQPASKPSPACPATPSCLLPPPPLHFAPHLPPPPGTMLGSAARPISARTVLWVPQPCPRAFPPCLVSRLCPVSGPDRAWFRVPSRSAATPFGSKAPPRLIPGSARVSRPSVRARGPHLLSVEPSAGARSARFVPIWLPLDSSWPVSSRI
jgi:hypothetical protein